MPKTKENTAPAISREQYVMAMQDSIVTRAHALCTELAVSICVYAEAGNVARDAKNNLREIYVASGMDAKDASGSAYKTTMRKIQLAALLYTHLSTIDDKLQGVLEGKIGLSKITAVAEFLKQFNFKNSESVYILLNKPTVRKAASAPQEPAKPTRSKGMSVAEFQQSQTNSPVENIANAKPEFSQQRENEPAQQQMFDEEDYDVSAVTNWIKDEAADVPKQREDMEYSIRYVGTKNCLCVLRPDASRSELLMASRELAKLAALLENEHVPNIGFLAPVAGLVDGNKEEEYSTGEVVGSGISAAHNQAAPMGRKARQNAPAARNDMKKLTPKKQQAVSRAAH